MGLFLSQDTTDPATHDLLIEKTKTLCASLDTIADAHGAQFAWTVVGNLLAALALDAAEGERDLAISILIEVLRNIFGWMGVQFGAYKAEMVKKDGEAEKPTVN
jgi:hypothetical protein